MKKLILFCVAFATALTSCGPEEEHRTWGWVVSNNTGQTLSLTVPVFYLNADNSLGIEYYTQELAKDEALFVYNAVTGVKESDRAKFGDYFDRTVSAFGTDVYWQLATTDGTVLKKWTYADMGKPGQRFFNESEWDFEEGRGDGYVSSWLFEIQLADIMP